MLAIQNTRNAAFLIFLVLLVGWLLYVVFNVKSWGKKEAGSEVELAPNRKVYFDDEELEGGRLERFQLFGLAMLVVSAIGLPLYWVLEPTRQAGAKEGYDKRFAKWGGQLFAPTAEGGFNCAGCHGGMKAVGGVKDYTITDPNTGEVKAVNWKAPALNTVMYRYSEDEVRYILQYGRPFSPMSPWGIEGGGPMNEQQLTTLIDYLKSIQIPQEGCDAKHPLCKGPDGEISKDKQAELQKAAMKLVESGQAKSLGEALFSLDYDSGALGCARCHTKGWSYDDPQATGGGAFGPNLTGGSEGRQFPNREDNVAFVCNPPVNGKKYGAQGQSSGKMPAFCGLYTDEQLNAVIDYVRSL
jgi:mono/diheme cytochrome c family protein